MEPFRIITTREELAALRIDSIIAPPRLPGSALRKSWANFTPIEGATDSFVGFGSTKEWNLNEAWSILTMHCAPDPPKPGRCGIPTRPRPRP